MRLVRFAIFCLILFWASIAHAGSSVTFDWDPNDEPDLAGYRIYCSATSGQYDYGAEHCVAEVPAGTVTATVENIPDGMWYWVATAFDRYGNESGPSNEVTATLDATAPTAPEEFEITATMKITVQLGTQ